MTKITLRSILSGFRSAAGLNSNFETIQAAMDNTLSRDGTGPNSMGAVLDMNSHRIINVAAPQSANDVVRLVDLEEAAGSGLIVGGGGGGPTTPSGPTDWADVTNKPTVFEPIVESVQDIVAAELVGGTNVTISYNDAAGKVTISASGGGGGSTGVDDAIVDGVVDRAPSQNAVFDALASKASTASLSGLILDSIADSDTTHAPSRNAVFDALGLKMNSNVLVQTVTNGDTTHVPSADAVYDAIAATGGGSVTMPNFVSLYGGVGDGITNNDAAINAFLADTRYERCWLPKGTYLHTHTLLSMSGKRFAGEGTLYKSTGTWVSDFRSLNVPAPSAATPYGVDQAHPFSDWNYAILQPNSRVSLNPPAFPTQNYFNMPATPVFNQFVTRSGGSGLRAHIPSGVSAGATSATLNSAAGLVGGMTVGIGPGQDGPWTDIVTITGVSGSTITFTPALSNSYPVNPAISAEGPAVSEGSRTMSPWEMTVVNHQAPGDAYVHLGRMICEYAGTAGQTHIFDRSTGGLYGGDITLLGQGNYATGTEILITDGGLGAANGGAVGDVRSYQRSDDTDILGVFWIDRFVQSFGSKPIDGGYVLAGNFRTGVDVARANFSTNDQAAIQLSTNQRIYFDSSANGAFRGKGIYSNVPGDTFMRHFLNAGNPTWEVARRDDLARWRMASVGGVGVHNVKGNVAVNGELRTNNVVFSTGGGAHGFGRLDLGNGCYIEGGGGAIYVSTDFGASYHTI